MEQISFACQACGKVLKVGADKAGRKAKCKCGAEVTIPAAGKPKEAVASAPAPSQAEAAAAPEPPPPPTPSDDDDDGGSYGVVERPLSEAELEAQELAKNKGAKKKKKKEKDEEKDEEEDEEEDEDEDEEDPEIQKAEEARRQRLRDMISLRKAPPNPKQWAKVRAGLLLVGSGACLLGVGWVLHCVFALMALQAPMEYAYVASTELVAEGQVPTAGQPLQLDKPRFIVALLTGADNVELGLWLLRLYYLFTLMALLVSAAGYGLCLAVPPRFGTRGLAIACLGLALVNLLLTLIFKLLPVTGVMNSVLFMLVGPEVAMAEANQFRIDPIHVTWSAAPFWETFLALLLHLLAMAELVVVAIFLRACALSLRDEVLEGRSITLIQLGLGTAFIQMSYLLLANAGTSEVLLALLQVVYVLFTGFYTGTLGWYVWTLFWSRDRIARKVKGL